jgi:hypothetical protein
LFNNEYSPIRTYLQTISPDDVKVLLTIDVQIIK